ncbi:MULTISPECIES: hypothetical protein [Micromonospora]|uniref:Uncharacterized protein n=1 Tax=Micromonospora yangpuensis TaxID=683228 RepID=A0A1C6V076_9ACTN|nr:hypothetical protein [Micromonospora yangpuensis]GGL96736.1 hypothetical protein GCM10012279_12780 [Micromonospora yangpuensis]SCL59715.1 hypothetical protein GA0070617_4178 [Micromonospora yangpuensis]
MARLVIAVDPATGISPTTLARTWEDDDEAAALGTASLHRPGPGTFWPGPAELVWVPLAVNLASTLLYDLIRRLVTKQRPPVDVTELELVETVSGDDRVVVIRLRRSRR